MDPDALSGIERVPHGSSDDPDVLDFSQNVNPRVPDGARAAYEAAFSESTTYPPEPPVEYREAAAEYVGCRPREVIPTPGGLAAIRLAVEAVVEPDDSVAVPYPSFGEYAREVRIQGATPAFVPHDEVVGIDPEDHALAIACQPNNPTGDAYDPGDIRSFATRCRDAGTVLLVDEAFLGFTDLASLAGRDGVVVARSLTKLFGLPGLRAGFAVATGDLRTALAAARRPWNLGTPAARVGIECMRDERFVAETRERVRAERARMREALSARFDVFPSDSPFLLLDVGDRPGEVVVDTAREAGIAIRDATTFRGLDSHVRVAVRTPAENDRLLEAMARV